MSEEQKQSSKTEKKNVKRSGWKKFLTKKWTFPAIYMAAAALILALIMWYQNPNDYTIDEDDLGMDEMQQTDKEQAESEAEDPEAVPVASDSETMVWPVAEDENTEMVTEFYNEEASEEEKTAAMIQYEDQYWPHAGVDFAKPDGVSFDVLAALSGEVVVAESDPVAGNIVEIQHSNSMKTVYQSLGEIRAEAGDQVEQGDVIGTAGRNRFEKDAGVHLHFEVWENGRSVSPETTINGAEKEEPSE